MQSATGVSVPANSGNVAVLGYLLPRFADVLFCALFVAAVLDGPRLLNGDGDVGRHLTVGEHILDTGRIPTRDLFSHSMAGQPFTPHEWLSEVAFAASHRLFGLNGVVLLTALLLAVTLTIVYRQAHERSGTMLLSAALTVWAAVAAHIHWLARPHLWTMLMVVLWTGHLERLRRGASQAWWVLPLLMLVWTNLHGAFIAGFVIWMTYGVGLLMDRVARGDAQSGGWTRAWALGGVTAAATSLMNPSGWHGWVTSVQFLRNQYLVDRTVEYMSPNFHTTSTWPFLSLLTLCLLAMGMGWLRLSRTSALLLASWTAMSLVSTRNIPLYSLMAAPILAEGLTAGALWRRPRVRDWVRRSDERLSGVERSLRGRTWPALIVLGTILSLDVGSRQAEARANRFDPRVFPVQAVDWMKSNPVSGNGFNHFPWGGYLLYRLWPEQKVFIDGQTDFYGEALTRRYETVITLGDGWQDVLRRHDVRWVLAPTRSPLVRRLSEATDWTVTYRDQTAVLLVRQN